MKGNLYKAYLAIAGCIAVAFGVQFLKNQSGFIDNVDGQIKVAARVVRTDSAKLLKLISDPNKVTYVNIWATWCEPCVEELPDLVKLKKKMGEKKFQLLLVSADDPDNYQGVIDFLKAHKISFTTYLKTEKDEPFAEALDTTWQGALPASIVFSPGGEYHESWVGITSYEKMLRVSTEAMEVSNL